MAYDETKVPVAGSMTAIRQLLQEHGVRVHAISEDYRTTPASGIVQFVKDDLQIRFTLQYKDVTKAATAAHSRQAARTKKTLQNVIDEMTDQEARRIWRVLFWTLKAKLIAVQEGLRTLEHEFLSDVVDPGDSQARTVWEVFNESGQAKDRIRLNGTGFQLPPASRVIRLPAPK